MTENYDAPESPRPTVEELEARIAELTRANALLADADRRKDEFLAMLGHELRNPLAAVAGSVELLLVSDLGPADHERVRNVLQRQVRQLSRLAEELLDVTRNLRSKPSNAAHPVATGAIQEKPVPKNPRRRRILLVDDNLDATETLAKLLQFIGQEVRIANDGATALQLAQSFQPELILLDIGLPEVSGFEVARCLRQLPEMKKVLLVALTGLGQEDDCSRFPEAGFNQHLVKPVTLRTIEALLNLGTQDGMHP